MFTAFDSRGSWRGALNLVSIVLLPKAGWGIRPIGLFPALIRFWMRAMYGLARAWQVTHALFVTFGGT